MEVLTASVSSRATVEPCDLAFLVALPNVEDAAIDIRVSVRPTVPHGVVYEATAESSECSRERLLVAGRLVGRRGSRVDRRSAGRDRAAKRRDESARVV